MAKRPKFYVVWEGVEPGIYDNWTDCKRQVEGFLNAKYKSFPNLEIAKEAYQNSYWNYIEKKESKEKKKAVNTANLDYIEENSICVDAACSGNPGKMEYRGVDMKTGKEIFRKGPYEDGTNNIGEFLALVHGIAYLKKADLNKTIYSDSATAIAWVRRKKAKTQLKKTSKNEELFQLLARAENYIQNTRFNFEIIKWETDAWGEIPADFGRK